MGIIHNLVSSSASLATQYGVQFTSGTLVNELQDSYGEVQLDTAIKMVGYEIGTTHPTYPLYTCIDIAANSVGPNEVKIDYTWEYKFPKIRYEVGSVSRLEQTNIDHYGDIIEAYYTYPEDYKENPEMAGVVVGTDGYGVSTLVDKFMFAPTLTITRQEHITGLDLIVKTAEFTNKLNSCVWMLVPQSSANSWMCTGISGASQDNGITYTVRYSFEHRSPVDTTNFGTLSGWDKQVIYIDPRTGQPPADADITPVRLYDEIDFNLLNLI